MTAAIAFASICFGIWLLLRKDSPHGERQEARGGSFSGNGGGGGDGPSWSGGDGGGGDGGGC